MRGLARTTPEAIGGAVSVRGRPLARWRWLDREAQIVNLSESPWLELARVGRSCLFRCGGKLGAPPTPPVRETPTGHSRMALATGRRMASSSRKRTSRFCGCIYIHSGGIQFEEETAHGIPALHQGELWYPSSRGKFRPRFSTGRWLTNRYCSSRWNARRLALR